MIVDENVADEMMNEVSSVDKQLDSSVKHIVYTGSTKEIISKTDLIITLGGDGTILRGVSLFSNVQVPLFYHLRWVHWGSYYHLISKVVCCVLH